MFLDETSAARRVSSKARSRQMPGSAPGDPMMVMDSQSTADGANGSEGTRENQSVDSLTHRLERIELVNDHRDELLLQCAQFRRLLEGFFCRTWLVEGDVASFHQFAAAQAQGKAHSEAARGQKGHQSGQPFMSVFAAVVNGPVTENPGVTGLAEIEVEWLNHFSQAAHLSIGCGPVFRDVECPRDSSERETSANSGKIPDANARPCSPGGRAEYQQAGTYSPQSPSPS